MHCGEFGVGNPIFSIVVPAKFRNLVLQLSHDQSRHVGVAVTGREESDGADQE